MHNQNALLVDADDRVLLALMSAVIFAGTKSHDYAVTDAILLLARVDKCLAQAVQKDPA